MPPDRVTSVLEFATHLQARLERFSGDTVSEDFPDIQLYTSILPFNSAELDKPQRASLTCHAITIWNLCNANTEQDNVKYQPAIAKCRAFAFLLLASAISRKKKTEAEKLLDHGVVAAKACLRADVIYLAAQVLENAIPPMSSQPDKHAHDAYDASSVRMAEYYALKLFLHWKDERADLAEHWYSRVEIASLENNQDISEGVIDLLLEIGSDYLSHDNFSNACKWLERARTILEYGENSTIFTGSDLKVNVFHKMVKSLLGLFDKTTNDSRHDILQRAYDIVAELKAEATSRLAVLLLSLEVWQSQSNCDADGALEDLMEIIRSVHLVDGTHNSILYYIRKLWPYRPRQSADCFRFYIVHRLLPQNDTERAERCIIIYLELCLDFDSTETSEHLHQLDADLSSFRDLMGSPLSPTAAQAAHVIIWKKICHGDNEASKSVAMLLCDLGLHALLSSATEGSLAKFERQLISYHLLITNHTTAREMLDNMTLKEKNNKHSRYLSYCLAIRSGNESDVQSDLNAILNGSGANDQLLYACLGESIKHKRHCDTARVLQRLVDQQIKASPQSESRDLVQFAVMTLVKICEGQQLDPAVREEFQARICAAFASAAQFQEKLCKEGRHRDRGGSSDWKWFSEQSFDIARAYSKTWPKKYIIDLLHYSNQMLQMETRGLAEAVFTKEERQRLFDCDFMCVILYSLESRMVGSKISIEDLPRTSYTRRSRLETSDYRYILHKQVFDRYSNMVKRQQATIVSEESEKHETLARLHILMPLAFEALLYMTASLYISGDGMFDEVSPRQFLQAANELEATSVTFALLADIVLTFASGDSDARSRCNDLRIPSLVAAKLLGQIIKTLRESKSYDLDQAARWIRCVVQLVLDDVERTIQPSAGIDTKKLKCEPGLMMLGSLVEQVCELALSIPSDIMSDDTETSMYPSDELQWLTSKLFNLAVDLHMHGKKALSQRWASEALKVARVMYRACGTVAARDLIALLQQRMEAMKLEVSSDE